MVPAGSRCTLDTTFPARRHRPVDQFSCCPSSDFVLNKQQPKRLPSKNDPLKSRLIRRVQCRESLIS